MRVYEKKQICSITKTLKEAHTEIVALINQGKTNIAISLMGTCQEVAFSIRDTLEHSEDDTYLAILQIDEYNKILFTFSLNVVDHDSYRYLVELNNKIEEVENRILNDTPNEVEMVFLSNEASMWDSFESVYLAAKEDPNCVPYVILVPFYAKKDGLIEKEPMKSGIYPDYIETLNWLEYNFEERHPEVIFIQNPYDDLNHVTSVHPFFYSQNLKKYTDLLCYIPYYIAIDQSNSEFLVNTKGVIYADKVFVQSEKLKENCIETYANLGSDASNREKLKQVAKNKFVALGSPKFDKIVNTKIEDIFVPEDWANLINNSDGSKKKVVFYNTSLSTILLSREKYNAKLRDVLEILKKRNDLVLLWRPHPLSKEAISSMRKEHLEEYLEIVENYKSEKWGIYDDTFDLNRAIFVSDAYYGDNSSVVLLFMGTGKPLMIQNVEKLSNAKENEPFRDEFNFFYEDGKNIYFTTSYYNGLFKAAKKSWTVDYIGSFPDEMFENEYRLLFGAICKNKDRLYFSPIMANGIGVYDLKTKEISKIEFYNSDIEDKYKSSEFSKFFWAFSYKESVFFTPVSYPAIMQYDIEKNTFRYHSDWLEKLKKYNYGTNQEISMAAIQNGSILALTSLIANVVIMFDMETYKSEIYEFELDSIGFYGIGYDGADYWIVSLNGEYIIRWNKETNSKQIINICFGGFIAKPYYFTNKIQFYKNYVYLLPHMGDFAIKICMETKSISVIDFFGDLDKSLDASGRFAGIKNIFISESGESALVSIGSGLKQINFKENTFEKIQLKSSERNDELLQKLATRSYYYDFNYFNKWQDSICTENKINLEKYLELIKNTNDINLQKRYEKQKSMCMQFVKNSDGTSGKMILELIKDEMVQKL